MVVLGPFKFAGSHCQEPASSQHYWLAIQSSSSQANERRVGELLAQLWHEAGIPKGVLNLVHGGSEVAQRLVAHPLCSGVLFTGSYRVGKLLHEALAGRLEVLLALELGGNNPLIVDRTESIDAAVYQIILSHLSPLANDAPVLDG